MPIAFRMVNGVGNVNVDIVNAASRKVVANRRYMGLAGPVYWGVPEATSIVPAVYIWKSPTTSVWTMMVKADDSPPPQFFRPGKLWGPPLSSRKEGANAV